MGNVVDFEDPEDVGRVVDFEPGFSPGDEKFLVTMENFGRRTTDALNPLNWPRYGGQVGGDLLALGTAGIETGFTRSGNTFSENVDAARNLPPIQALQSGPHVDTFDMAAAAKTAPTVARRALDHPIGQTESIASVLLADQMRLLREENTPQPSIGDVFTGERDELVDAATERYLQHPKSGGLGLVGGDALGLMSMRGGGLKALKNASTASRLNKFLPNVSPVTGGKPVLTPVPESIPKNWKRFLDRKFGDLARGMKEGGLKMGETGIDAMWVAAQQDEDPLPAAAWSAGVQGAANMAKMPWDAMPDIKGHKGFTLAYKLVAAAIVTGGLAQIGKSYAPGGKDYSLESTEFGYDKVAFMLAASLAANAAGFNRPTQMTIDDIGGVADLANSFKRGAAISLISEWQNDDNVNLQKVKHQILTDVSYFTAGEQRRIEKALMKAASDEDDSFKEAIDAMMEVDPDFRRKVNSIGDGQQ